MERRTPIELVVNQSQAHILKKESVQFPGCIDQLCLKYLE